MQAFKVTRKDGIVYYSRAMSVFQLLAYETVASVELAAEETPYVKAACTFFMGTGWNIEWQKDDLSERVIRRMIDGECLWHALAQETETRCYCAHCQPTERRPIPLGLLQACSE